jgi:tetratricopeptide (TPR) repeat protein/SAM-dependent methyltransferase
MNRKDRRAAGKAGVSGRIKTSAPGSGSWLDQLLATAQRHVAAGQFALAEAVYRDALAADPRHIAALHGLSHIAYQTGRHQAALDLLERAIAVDGRIAELHYSIAAVLHALGRLAQAGAHCAKAAELRPEFAEAWFGQGNVLAELGQLEQAAACYRRAIAVRPDYAEALSNLGNVLSKLGRAEDAMREWQRAVAVAPNFPLPHVNLGAALAQCGRHDSAVQHLRRALELVPDDAVAAALLAESYAAMGDVAAAWEGVRRALGIRETPEARAAFIHCLKRFRLTADAPDIRKIAARALEEPWQRPALLAGPIAELLKTAPDLADCIARVAKAWPRRLTGPDLWSDTQRTAICGDRLLRLLLASSPICDLELEWFLTTARCALLDDAERTTAGTVDATALEFYCALARQCFINEYVYGVGDDELPRIRELRAALAAALDAGTDVSPLWIIAVAAYGALHTLPQASALTAREWPSAVRSLLVQQMEEPQAEAQLRASIPALTSIDDTVSLVVQAQYEANPYPRWVKAPRDDAPRSIADHLRGLFPGRDIRGASTDGSDGCDILVAGCGTGQHAIGVALRYRDARVLAIDLSLSSLAYAKRQARAMGVSRIAFAQADILHAASLGRSFDLIETAGVLHHLDDPMAGWRALIPLLRPNAVMYVALYSELARQSIAAVRSFIAARGYRPTDDDIGRFRQDLVTREHGLPLEGLFASPDFFSASGCRDLLFHVCEHRLTIPQIKSFLDESGLELIGFALDDQALEQLRRRFPGVDATADLDLMHVFETENPNTFAAMYNFWVRKAG